MMLSTHFTLAEFIESDTAHRLGIDNDLPAELYAAAKSTAEMLERIRGALCDVAGKTVPIIVTSGYRCPALNRAIGSKETSDHTRAMAADIKAPEFGSPAKLAKFIGERADYLGVGQVIYEFGSWVHVSARLPDKTINRIITINKSGTFPGVVEA